MSDPREGQMSVGGQDTVLIVRPPYSVEKENDSGQNEVTREDGRANQNQDQDLRLCYPRQVLPLNEAVGFKTKTKVERVKLLFIVATWLCFAPSSVQLMVYEQRRSGDRKGENRRERHGEKDGEMAGARERKRNGGRDGEGNGEREGKRYGEGDRDGEGESEGERGGNGKRTRDRDREKDGVRNRGRDGEGDGERGRERDEGKDGESGGNGDRDGKREGDRQRDGEGDKGEKDGEGDGEMEIERHRAIESGGKRDGERDRDEERDSEREENGQKDRDLDGEKHRGRERDGERNGERDEDRDGDGERDTERDGNGQKDRDRYGDGERDRDTNGNGEREGDREGLRGRVFLGHQFLKPSRIFNIGSLLKERKNSFIHDGYMSTQKKKKMEDLIRRELEVTASKLNHFELLVKQMQTLTNESICHDLEEVESELNVPEIWFKQTKTLKDESVRRDLGDIKKKQNSFHHKSDPQKFGELADFFGRLQPTMLSGFVYPVSRHTSEKRGESSNNGPEPQEPRHGQAAAAAVIAWPPKTVHGVPWGMFCQELYRLGTFFNMPLNFPVFAVKLAQAGFLHLENNAIVCYFCGLRQDEWTSGKPPLKVHRQLRPECSLLTGVNCDNVAVETPQPDDQLAKAMQIWSLSEAQSPQTVKGQLQDKAQSNFFTTPQRGLQSMELHEDTTPSASGDSTQAHAAATSSSDTASRGGATGSSNQNVTGRASGTSNQNVSGGSNPATPKQLPRPGLMGGAAANANPGPSNAASVTIYDGTAQPEPPATERQGPARNETRQVVTYDQLGIITARPKQPNMVMLNSRVGTYRGWPNNHPMSPLDLSEAGFYFAGYADCARCFQCGVGLKKWEAGDNPWVAHALVSPKCAYVKQCQGQDFMDVVQELKAQGRNNAEQVSLTHVAEEISRRRAGGDHIQAPVVDPAISSAVHAGFRQEDVDSAVRRLTDQGHQLTADTLVDYLEAEGSEVTPGSDIVPEDASADPEDVLEELKTENREIRQRHMCKICLDREAAIVFLPCGHLTVCAQCSPVILKCPVCRLNVRGRVRVCPS